MAEQHSVYAVCFIAENQAPSPVEQPELQQLIDQNSDLFEEPKQLPHRRDIDPEFPSNMALNQSMYARTGIPIFRNIERQVFDMLKSGLIRPSTSPFSSLVLLVRKKEKTW